jgi:hypothetical protein
MCGAPREPSHTRGEEARRSRGLLAGVGRVGRARLLDHVMPAGGATAGSQALSAVAVFTLIAGCYRALHAGVGYVGFAVAASSGHTTAGAPSCHWIVTAL